MMPRLALLLACALLPSGAAGSERPARTVLVELFTSQGCSSCPAADRLLTKIGSEGIAGAEVIALSFHVDYWNYIGWTDPFSAPEWSWRQRRYAAQFRSDRVYTPQLVVDGVGECVGAYRRDVREQVRVAAQRAPLAQIELALGGDRNSPNLAVTAGLGTAAAGDAELLVAIVETALETTVGRGENARRTLRNDHVVRRLLSLGPIAPGEEVAHRIALEIESDWRLENLGVVVFVQSSDTLEVHGAARSELPTG